MKRPAKTPSPTPNTAIRERFQTALADLVEQLKQDRTVLAAILCGSLSYDDVWEKSDIDLIIVCNEDLKTTKSLSLSADGIIVHAMLIARASFKKRMQSAVGSSFFHSYFSKSTLLFSHDESIVDLYQNVHHIGERDREIQLLEAATMVLPALAKIEKWLVVKKDVNYCFVYFVGAIMILAKVEALLHGEIISREVIHQALRLNPDFFVKNYTELIKGPKTEKTMRAALDAINDYLLQRLWIFQPVLDYLDEAHGIRSTTEINHYFNNQYGIESADMACEWLSDQEIIDRVSTPVRLTTKSRIQVEEAAYYYHKDDTP